jgi:hypothetical protein
LSSRMGLSSRARQATLVIARTIAAGERPVTIDPKLSVDNRIVSASSEPSAAQSQTTTTLLDPPPPDPAPQPRRGLQLWLHRTSVFLFVLICAVAGVLLVILPWTPEWTDNYLLLSFPWLRTFVSTGFFRGLCSGLGLLDIWIGFAEALHYHEHS